MINTGIDSSLLRPQTFHVITYLLGNRALQPLPQRAVCIGPQSAAATAVAGTIYEIADPSQIDTLFGIGSYLSLMLKKSLDTAARLGAGPRLFACAIAAGTTAMTKTMTWAGTSTIAGDAVFRVAGRYITVGLPLGMAAANAAAAALPKVQALKSVLPFTAAVAGAVVTFTDVNPGVLGSDAIFETVSLPVGLTVTFANGTAGAGTVDLQPALDAIAGQDFDGVAVCNHQTADITEINAHIASTWTASAKRPRWFFVGEPGSIATGTTLATAANHEGVVIVSWEQSRSLPCEIAASAMVGALSKSRPNANYDGMTLPLYPPPASYVYTNGEIETALASGLTPLTATVDPATQNVIDGVGNIVRLITSRTTLGGVPFTLLRDFGISRTTWYMAKQYDLRYAAQFGSLANPDGVLLTDDTRKQLRDMVINLNFAAQSALILRNVDADKDLIVAETDAVTSGRVNVDSSYTIVVGLHQVAFVHRAYQ